MNVFELARLSRLALMAQCLLECAPMLAPGLMTAESLAGMSREALVTAILRARDHPPGPLPRRHPGASSGEGGLVVTGGSAATGRRS